VAQRNSASAEAFSARWKRRRVTIPTMLAATAAAVLLSPVVVAGAVVWDLVRLRWRFPTVRVYLFACQYLLNDSVEVLAAGPLWVAAGFGARLDRPVWQRRHQRLQAWSIAVLAGRAERLLGVRLDTDAQIASVLVPAPAIVVCRHVNLLDASLPSLLYQRLGYHTRGVIMAELLADPGFDLLYQRAGSVFIPRDNSIDARALVADVAEELDDRSVAVIFPEGRLFRPELLAGYLAKVAERDPARGARLAGLRHLLPPRPGGLSVLLDALPDADVVVIDHAGLDPYPTFAELARHVPLPDPIRVTARRVARADIPDDPDARVEWLDTLWVEMDRWVHDNQL
jgi:1-acyl-sn-glycerol-3-phosphate acyltransferase